MTTTPLPELDEATLWLASTADVAREDGKPALAEIAERTLDELTRLRQMELAAQAYIAAHQGDGSALLTFIALRDIVKGA